MDARGRLLGLLACVALLSLCGSAQASPSAPEVSVGPPSGIATGEAALRGQVNPGEQPTTYQFEYGTTAGYGKSAPAAPASAGTGAAAVDVSVHIVGLQPGVQYHFRLVATNATETVGSEDATFATYPLPAPQSGGCPNEERRAEQGAMRLPDCRAYEMVSPLDKKGSDIIAVGRLVGSSLLGDGVVYPASAGFGDSTGSGASGLTDYLARRKEGVGWESHGITPTSEPEIIPANIMVEFSGDLRYGISKAYDLVGPTNDIPSGYNLYREDTETRSLETVTAPLVPVTPGYLFEVPGPRGMSEDLADVVTFESKLNMLPAVTGTRPKLYAWERGILKVAGVMPDGSLPTDGSQAAAGESAISNRETVSRDGSRVMFIAKPDGSSNTQLYIRKNGESTVWVSEPEMEGATSEPSSVQFWAMTPDGKKIVFSTKDQLINDDPGGGGNAFYMYTDGSKPDSESNLTFLGRGFSELTGMSEDGSRIYFGSSLWDKGTLHSIPAITVSLKRFPAGVGGDSQAMVSADGRTLAFVINQRLGGAAVGAPEGNGTSLMTLYVYDESNESFTCVSCIPTGQLTTSDTQVEPQAAYLVATPPSELRPRFLSSDGQRVFFSTADPLVAQDTNGVEDAYEYDVSTKRLQLLSTGTGASAAWFASSDVEGKNVFIATSQPLLPQDTDTLVDLYDVRVDGGFPQPQPPGSCVGDECQGTPSAAPSFATASGFSGLGNITLAKQPAASFGHKALTRAQRLARALKACRSKPKSRRRHCISSARKRYGVNSSVKKASR